MNVFAGIDLNILTQEKWNILNDTEKINILRKIENNMSKIHERKCRNIIYLKEDNGQVASYQYSTPDNIYIYKLDNFIDCCEAIIHEGIHAMFDDASKGKINKIKIIFNSNFEDIYVNIVNRDIIHNHFFVTNRNVQFDLEYLEERIAHYDPAIYIINSLYNDKNKNYPITSEAINKLLLNALNYFYYMNQVRNKYGSYGEELSKIDYLKYSEHMNKCDMFFVEKIELSFIEDLFKQSLKMQKEMPKIEIDSYGSKYFSKMPVSSDSSNLGITQKSENKVVLLEPTSFELSSKKYPSYESLDKETKKFVESIIWIYNFSSELYNKIFFEIIYPQYEKQISEEGKNKIQSLYNGFSYCKIMEIIKKRAYYFNGNDQIIISLMTSSECFDFVNKIVANISCLLAFFEQLDNQSEYDLDLKNQMEQMGINIDIVRKIFETEKHYGGIKFSEFYDALISNLYPDGASNLNTKKILMDLFQSKFGMWAINFIKQSVNGTMNLHDFLPKLGPDDSKNIFKI